MSSTLEAFLTDVFWCEVVVHSADKLRHSDEMHVFPFK